LKEVSREEEREIYKSKPEIAMMKVMMIRVEGLKRFLETKIHKLMMKFLPKLELENRLKFKSLNIQISSGASLEDFCVFVETFRRINL
jgi:hypothetical protein